MDFDLFPTRTPLTSVGFRKWSQIKRRDESVIAGGGGEFAYMKTQIDRVIYDADTCYYMTLIKN